MSLSKARVDVLIWVLIYVGLVLIGLGLSVQRRDSGLGWGIVTAGGVATVFGVIAVWARSRMKEER